MGKATRLLSALIKEYGDDAVRIARGVLGMDAEPAAVEQAVKRIAQRKPAARAPAARQQPDSLAVRRVPALPAPKGVKHPAREGYSVRPHVSGKDTFAVYNPDGTMHRAPTVGESDAWEMAYRAANPDLGKYKPRGGQWLPNDDDVMQKLDILSPEHVAKRAIGQTGSTSPAGVEAPSDLVALRDWWERAVPKYLKNDLGTETDPLLDLASRGLLHMPDTTPDQWRRYAAGAIMDDPIGWHTLPPHAIDGGIHFGPDASMREALLEKAPWLAKQPMTDSLYSFSPTGSDRNLELGHVVDELVNALNPQMSGLPSDLAIRPESFQRMSFPQAVERVGNINQWRAKRAEEEQLAAMVNNPAIHTYKEYPEAGMRWVELKQPDTTGDALPEGYTMSPTLYDGKSIYEVRDPNGYLLADYPDPQEALQATWRDANRKPLKEALRAEGDAMGHCVGGYCDDVASGRSRIFSLRDAKGNPHVTVEASPGRKMHELTDVADPDLRRLRAEYRDAPDGMTFTDWVNQQAPDVIARYANPPDDIVQIKGKQNRAPIDDYLPYVQDFVKSGTWGNIGDLGNTGLVKLPDGRYITSQQAEQGIGAIPERIGNAVYDPSYLHAMDPQVWEQVAPHFEGFAVGGRVDASRCFSRNPLSVR